MAHLVSRRKIVALIVLAIGAALIAVTVAAWPSGPAHPGGDPAGRLMAEIAPVARVIPGFERRVPWIAFPCDTCQFPTTYATKIEPQWDSCDGMAGTFGWDPVIIQIGFQWKGSDKALMNLLNQRLNARGWARGAVTSWSGDQGPDANWISPLGHGPTEEFALDAPADGLPWMATIEAKPMGPLVKGC